MPYIGEIKPRMRFSYDNGKLELFVEVFGVREFPMQETEISYRFSDTAKGPVHGSLYALPESAFRAACYPIPESKDEAPEDGRVWGNQ